MDVAVGVARITRGVPSTAIEISATLIFVNVNCTDDALAGVPAPTTMTAVVALTTEQDEAAVPELGVAPTLALHAKPTLKLVPVTVTVFPTKTGDGDKESTVGEPS